MNARAAIENQVKRSLKQQKESFGKKPVLKNTVWSRFVPTLLKMELKKPMECYILQIYWNLKNCLPSK